MISIGVLDLDLIELTTLRAILSLLECRVGSSGCSVREVVQMHSHKVWRNIKLDASTWKIPAR